MKRLGLAIAAWLALAAVSSAQVPPNDGGLMVPNAAPGGGGSSTITANSTATSGGSAGCVWYNASSKMQCDGGFTYAGNGGEVSTSGGTVGGSATTPFLSITGTWNTTGVVDAGLFMNITNTASGTDSLLMDLQVGALSKLVVKANGTMLLGNPAGNATAVANTNGGIGVAGNGYYVWNNSVLTDNFGNGGVQLNNADLFFWCSSANLLIGCTNDTGLGRSAAGLVEVNNGTLGTFRDLKPRHLVGGGAAPTANACTGFALLTGGSDLGGKITYTSATTCSVTFGTAFTNAPACTVTPGSAAATTLVTTATTGFAVTFGAAQTAFAYSCIGA